jgi:hypothetical protein
LCAQTNCKQPCHETEYSTIEYKNQKLTNTPSIEPAVTYITEQGFNPNVTTILILDHVKSKKLLKMNEVYQYSALQFIGDAGGTIGIFVGMSFYSIYLDVMEFIMTKIRKTFHLQ